MGEARRRSQKDLSSGKVTRQRKNSSTTESTRIVPWLPITLRQKEQFYSITKLGAWVGIGVSIVTWIVVRVIGPAAGWWTPADMA